MSRIQLERNTDLPRAIGSAWKVPILQVVEERRVVPIRDAVEDRQVELHQLLDVVEHAPQRRGLVAARQRFDGAVGQQVDVQLRAVALHRARQGGRQRPGRGARLGGAKVSAQELAQQRRVVA
jgi:hypothetical protein